jgi:hypothetical protein
MTTKTLPTPDIALLREDIYVVLSAQHTVGFVHKVGNVFVALAGGDLGRACEVGQSLSWDDAVAMVQRTWEDSLAVSTPER